MKEFYISTENDLINPIKWLFDNRETIPVITLEGQLGAGKTAFVKKAIKHLGSEDTIKSPTYSIINEYHYPKGISYHMDLYRLNTLEEALDIGIEEYIYSGNLCLIEWAEIINPILPQSTINIKIDVQEDSSRKLLISNL